VILKITDLSRQAEVAIDAFRDLKNRLEGDGYIVFIVPKRSMNEKQIRAFCDRALMGSVLAAA
jgi:hypothetical protein